MSQEIQKITSMGLRQVSSQALEKIAVVYVEELCALSREQLQSKLMGVFGNSQKTTVAGIVKDVCQMLYSTQEFVFRDDEANRDEYDRHHNANLR